jgi:hypothetical protein
MFRAVCRSSSGALTVFAASGLHTHVVTGRSQVSVGTQLLVVSTVISRLLLSVGYCYQSAIVISRLLLSVDYVVSRLLLSVGYCCQSAIVVSRLLLSVGYCQSAIVVSRLLL